MIEYVVDEAVYMHPAPASLSELGVLTEPLSIAEKGVGELCAVQSRLPGACRPKMPNPQRKGGLVRREEEPPLRKGETRRAPLAEYRDLLLSKPTGIENVLLLNA